jgi:small subunit ribosomal protein S5
MMADDKNQTPEGEETAPEAVAPEAAAPEAVEAAAPEAAAPEAVEAAAPEAEAPVEAAPEAAPEVEAAAPEAEAAAPEAAPEPAAPQAAPAPAPVAAEPAELASPVMAGSGGTDRPEGRGPRGGRGGRGGGGGGGRDNRGGGNRGRRDERGRGRDDDGGEELIEKLVHINRVSKTVKGGKRFGFAALVVVGDGKGRAGFGHGKAREVPEAISKATAAAKKAMVRVPLRDGRTLHHDGLGHFGAGRVYVRSAPAGTGIIAGGPMRAVFESLGVADVVTKSIGTSNPYNMIRATFEALGEQTSPKSVAQRRGKKIADLMARRDGVTSAAEASAEAEALVE